MYPHIEKALENLSTVFPAGECGHYFGESELGDLECKEVAAFPGITSLNKLYAVLRLTWSKKTAYHSCQSEWVTDDPSYGQCAITAMLVCDMFGGTIHRIRNNSGGTHYFNKINNHYVDLTREQFDLYDLPVNYEPNDEIPRERCGTSGDARERYHQLQRNIIAYCKGMEINQME